MSLHGTLDTLSIPEILDTLEAKEKTGALAVDGNLGSGTLYFRSGKLTAGGAPGLVIPPASDAQFEGLVIDVCFELLRQEQGTFDFTADDASKWERDHAFIVHDVLQIAQAALEDWEKISDVLPDMNIPLALASAISSTKIAFSAEAWQIIAAIDGRRGVTQLAAITENSRIEVARELVSLIESGAVVVVEKPSEPVVLEEEIPEPASHTDTDIAEALVASLTDKQVEVVESPIEVQIEGSDEADGDEEDSELPGVDQEGSASNPDRGALLRMFSSLREP